MNIAICNSKKWFKLDRELKEKHNILNINDNDELNLSKLELFSPDLIFFPHWNWFVSEEILSKFNCILFHTAPLPFGRGGSPIQNLIIRGFKKSPVYAIKMTKEIDSGPIYDKEIISLEGSLSKILKQLNVAVNIIIRRLVIKLPKPKKQEGKVVVFNRLGNADNEIMTDMTIDEIYDKIRMLDDKSYPSAFYKLKNISMEFFEIIKKDEEIICKVRLSNKGNKNK